MEESGQELQTQVDAVTICTKRYLIQGMRTWKANTDIRIKKETVVENTIVKKMRLRLVKSAFEIYKENTRKMK
jgi:hypothetical protein